MKLSTKLSISVLAIILLIFIGMFYITINNNRSFYINQLNSNAHDTATSLGLSLSQALALNDRPLMLSMVQAVFDRGYFKSIAVTDIDNQVLVSRSYQAEQSLAPTWFMEWFPLQAASQKSIVMHGWQQVGWVNVVTDSGWAYQAMWKSTRELLYWYCLLSLLAFVAVLAFMHWLLRPLKSIIQQAKNIGEKNFIIQEKLPKTPELRRVGESMNTMVLLVKGMYDTQLKQIEKLRRQTYVDELTQLDNRRSFFQQMHQCMLQQDEFVNGFVILLSVEGLDLINKELEAATVDYLLKDVANVLNHAEQDPTRLSKFRIRGSQFALICKNYDFKSIVNLMETVNDELEKIFQDYPLATYVMGCVDYHQFENIDELLSRADQVLHNARHSSMQYRIETDQSMPSILINIHTLENAILNMDLSLHVQDICDLSKSSAQVQQEIFVRLELEGESIKAGYFMHSAENLKMASKIDQYVLDKIIEKQYLSNRSLALNISLQTVTDSACRNTLLNKLKSIDKSLHNNLSLEINECIVHQHPQECMEFANTLKSLQFKLGVDQIGAHFDILNHIKQMPIDYIKIDGSLLHDMQASQYKQFYVQYITETAQSLGITLIASQIETQSQVDVLRALGIDLFQGSHISKIEPLPH